MTTIDLKELQALATAEASRAVQSAAARWWSIEDIALQMRYSVSSRHTATGTISPNAKITGPL